MEALYKEKLTNGTKELSLMYFQLPLDHALKITLWLQERFLGQKISAEMQNLTILVYVFMDLAERMA